MGLHQAGFEVTGVDLLPQPSYPFEFVQADALTFSLDGFDLIWASPPCQRYMTGGNVNREGTPDLIGDVRDRLGSAKVEWIIENVPGAPLRKDVTLCGSHFGLKLRRHRVFELSFSPPEPPPCDHTYPVVGVYGHPHGGRGAYPTMLPGSLQSWREAMGIDWMSAKELSQAIPPAYSKFLAERFLGEE